MDAKQIETITQLVVQALQNTTTTTADTVPVGVSARHVHLTQEHVEMLYGVGHQLTKKKELMGGQFACDETLTLISPQMKIMEHVRVLGPVRSASQVEISATDAMKLKLNAPLRDSGDIAGSAGVTLLGPQGTVSLTQGCIVATRHIHMSPADASRFGVVDKQMVSVRFDGARATVMEQVLIRVDSSFTLEMHIDTDEANAVQCNGTAHIIK